ncbi:efflux RND transporter periplasmic adaptor subunit [Albibacterium profundi]|uniref:Efflux RND transporter periplasmic adaptor subunit n=1 Tax=Albibacterium profundi TaxID=3134906 RepID=A0ABV5CGH2_9SPHI
MLKKNTVLQAIILPTILLIAACGGNSENKQNAEVTISEYPILTIEPRSTTLNSNYPATIEGQQNIEIRPKIEGFIEHIYVDEGATVKQGQALFRISAPQYEQEKRSAEAAVKIAEAAVNTAQMEVNKVRPLVEKNIISRYQLESAQFNLESQQAQLAQARANLTNASTNVGYTLITSPVNGVVGTLPYKIGSLVSSNTPQPLTTVSNITNIYAYFSINEKQMLEISGREAEGSARDNLANIPQVSLILANGSQFPYPGRIETTSGLINTATGSISVRATFPNPGNVVRSGSSGVIIIPLELDSAIVIPQKSTYEIQGKKFVYQLQEDNTVTSKSITVMDNDDGQFYVVNAGLKPGDKIVMEGLATLRDGLNVQPVAVNADSLFKPVTTPDTVR